MANSIHHTDEVDTKAESKEQLDESTSEVGGDSTILAETKEADSTSTEPIANSTNQPNSTAEDYTPQESSSLSERPWAVYDCLKPEMSGPVKFNEGDNENTIVDGQDCVIDQLDFSKLFLKPGRISALEHYFSKSGKEMYIWGTDGKGDILLIHSNPNSEVIVLLNPNSKDLHPNDFGDGDLFLGTLGTYFQQGAGIPNTSVSGALLRTMSPAEMQMNPKNTIFVQVLKNAEQAQNIINKVGVGVISSDKLNPFRQMVVLEEGFTILIDNISKYYQVYDSS